MLRRYAGSLLMLLVRIGSSLAVNKLFAYYLGAIGITILAHLQNMFSMVTLVPAEGVGKGLVKYISDRGISREERHTFLLTGLLWHLFIWMVGCLAFLVFHPYFFQLFPPEWSRMQWFAMVVGALFGQVIYLYVCALLLAAQKVKLYLITQIASSALVLVSVGIFISQEDLTLTLLCFITGQGLSAAVVAGVMKGSHISLKEVSAELWQYVHQQINPTPLQQAFIALGKYSLMALSVVFFGKTVDFFVRQFAVQEFGIKLTGLWQAVVRTSELYTQIFTALLGIVYFPRVAAVISKREEVTATLKKAIGYWLPLILLGLIGVYLARFQVLYLIYDENFMEGAVFFKWQLSGDLFIMLSYFFAYILLGKARIRLFILLQAISATIYVLAIFLLYEHLGIEALPIAYLVRSAGYALCLIIFTAKEL